MTSTARDHEELAAQVTRLFEEQQRTQPLARRAGDVVPSVHCRDREVRIEGLPRIRVERSA